MTLRSDIAARDLFGRFPQPADLTNPSFDLRLQIATRMSAAMKRFSETQEKAGQPGDRFEIAARMSRIYGSEVTKTMLDAYAAASKSTHIPNIAWSFAFDRATEQHELLNLYCELCGARAVFGADNLLLELLDVQQQKERLTEKETALKKAIRRSRR